MTIEDFPEMLLVDISGTPFKFNKGMNHEPFTGDFVVLQGKNSKNYIFSSQWGAGHQEISWRFWELLDRDYGVENEKPFPKSGGHIDICGQVRVYSKSQRFGKYDEQIVRPIVERWAKENTPGYKLIFE